MIRFSKLVLLFFTFYFSLFTSSAQNTYTNPILAGFYPDPSLCRVGDDYYLVNSTFSYFPGIPVFHSKDLVNWKLIGHVIDRAEQIDYTGRGVSRSIFAPTIRYHNGLYYVTCTMIDGKGNFVATATNPAGPWSKPYWLPIDGIDPSLFFDDDGQTYIAYNSIPPGNQSLYNGHRTIRMNKFDAKEMKIISSDTILVNGGTDISKKPSWIEGPHILKKDGYYYLISAEGGTGADHSVVAFRSNKPQGPYVSYEGNPILTQRNLEGERKFPITSTGHADLVQLPNGKWWSIFLGTRPYEGDYYNTGRETFLTPVEWKDGWPILNPGEKEVKYQYPLPLPAQKTGSTYSGNFFYKDDFTSAKLSSDWIFLRTPKEAWWNMTGKKGFLTINVRPETAGGLSNPSFVARRQQHLQFSASTALQFQPQNANEKAGLTIFQNETHFYFICRSVENGKPVVQLYQSGTNRADSNNMKLLTTQELKGSTAGTLQLKITGKNDQYSFYYSDASGKWQTLKEGVDGKFLSTKEAGGFVGATIALYATSLGSSSNSKAYYDWFSYTGDDEVYKK
jgi:xylan 1,4-beta-xylosidase